MKVIIAELEPGDVVIVPGLSRQAADAFCTFAEENLRRLDVRVFVTNDTGIEDVLILRASRAGESGVTAAGDSGLLTMRNPRPGDDDALARP